MSKRLLSYNSKIRTTKKVATAATVPIPLSHGHSVCCHCTIIDLPIVASSYLHHKLSSRCSVKIMYVHVLIYSLLYSSIMLQHTFHACLTSKNRPENNVTLSSYSCSDYVCLAQILLFCNVWQPQ